MTNMINSARCLRKNLTFAEIKLWQKLRRRQLAGLRFQRQVPIGYFIVDFMCYEARLIVELDGGHHNEDQIQIDDAKRTAWLQNQGYTVLRFWNNEVLKQIEDVLQTILRHVPPSLPSPARGEGAY
jgi:very-short-patch-repair endonuclease